RRSTSVTWAPRSADSQAAATPARPPPHTTTRGLPPSRLTSAPPRRFLRDPAASNTSPGGVLGRPNRAGYWDSLRPGPGRFSQAGSSHHLRGGALTGQDGQRLLPHQRQLAPGGERHPGPKDVVVPSLDGDQDLPVEAGQHGHAHARPTVEEGKQALALLEV